MKGLFDRKLIASAKLTSMEKYGFTYNSDLMLVESSLEDVIVHHLDEGKVRVTYNGKAFEVFVRDYVPPRKPVKDVEGDRERKNRWVSIWDIENH